MGSARRTAGLAAALAAALAGGATLRGDTMQPLAEHPDDDEFAFVWSVLNLAYTSAWTNDNFRDNPTGWVPSRGGAPSRHLTLEEGAAPTFSLVRSGGAAGHLVLGTPFDLHPPFRWEVTAGRIRPGSAGALAGFFCTELDGRDTSPLEYYAFCSQPSGDGYQVWVARAGENLLGLTTIPSAAVLDLAVEHDGETLSFLARPAGEGEFTEIHSLAHAPGIPLVPSMGGAWLPEGARVDFARFRIASNGPLPGDASPEATHARALAGAAGTVLDAFHGFDTLPADPAVGEGMAAGAEALRAAEAALRAEAPVMADPKGARRAAKAARTAAAAAAKTAALVAKGSASKALGKNAIRSVEFSWRAVQEVDPHSLPGN